MFRKHVTRQISAFLHGELSADDKLRFEAHLRECARCRAAVDEIREGTLLASTLSPSIAPESIWNEIQQARMARPHRRFVPKGAFASLAVVAMIVVIFFLSRTNVHEDRPSWEVAGLPGVSRLRPGDALETNAASEAQVKIADIGQLTIAPNTRIRLLVTRPDEHRIALDRGKVEALTIAPPRVFIVDTPAATAIDLGCKYTLEVGRDGGGLLHVMFGLVALEFNGRETIVPAGAFCRTRSGAGPGTPFFEDSSTRLQSSLEYLDSGKEGVERSRQLEIVLSESRVRDALTLWHLLPRVDAQSRGQIYDRLAQLIPPPPEVTRDGIKALDPMMLDVWKATVSQLWQ